MEFTNFFHFINGYVILRLCGHNKEVNLEKMRKAGVSPRNIVYSDDAISVCISASEYQLIEDRENELNFTVAKMSGGRFFLNSLKRRWVLAVGVAIIFLAFFVGSKFIWTIEISGASKENIPQIENALELAGIKVGAIKTRLDEPMEIKNTILANTKDIAWCWVYIKGTKAVIDIRENIIPPQIFDPDVPCDIVAAKDGIIKKIITKRGECIVDNETAVSCGDVLIKGQVSIGEEESYLTHASGICEADTFYEKEGIYKLYRNHKTYTGRKRNLLSVKLFGLSVPLYFNSETDFEFYDSEKKMYEISLGKENYLGVGLEKVSFIEYNIIKEPISAESCAEFARYELEAEIAKELLPGSVKKSSEISVDKIDEETVSVKIAMEFTEQIGTEKLIEEVTFIEPKTD